MTKAQTIMEEFYASKHYDPHAPKRSDVVQAAIYFTLNWHDPVPCQHIADYYQHSWERQHCIGFNLLRHGYAQWARGGSFNRELNNLF